MICIDLNISGSPRNSTAIQPMLSAICGHRPTSRVSVIPSQSPKWSLLAPMIQPILQELARSHHSCKRVKVDFRSLGITHLPVRRYWRLRRHRFHIVVQSRVVRRQLGHRTALFAMPVWRQAHVLEFGLPRRRVNCAAGILHVLGHLMRRTGTAHSIRRSRRVRARNCTLSLIVPLLGFLLGSPATT
jgi:hypothetical protein